MRRERAKIYYAEEQQEEEQPKVQWSEFILRLHPELANVDPNQDYQIRKKRKGGRPRIIDLQRQKDSIR
jgi:hypothetical protein